MKTSNAAIIRELEPEEIKDFARRIYQKYGGDYAAMTTTDQCDLIFCLREYFEVTGKALTHADFTAELVY